MPAKSQPTTSTDTVDWYQMPVFDVVPCAWGDVIDGYVSVDVCAGGRASHRMAAGLP